MKSIRPAPGKSPSKAPTGITGFDEMTDGGLPRGHTTLLLGGPGSGKTVFALQFLAHGARHCREPGIFVAFEETAKRIEANAESFGWKLAELQRQQKLFLMDAHPASDLIRSGDFDLGGMLATLEAKTRDMRARRIVFDALDVVLALLPDAMARRREVNRLHEWLLARGLTGLITAKTDANGVSNIGEHSFDFMQYMVDCTVILKHSVALGVSQRNLRVEKYRGSDFDEDESPFVIGSTGLEVAAVRASVSAPAKAPNERVSSGVKRLDTMLGGGYFRGASVLITGSPGTAKTTLSAAFAEAACRRGERTLFVSFDSDSAEVLRNLASVGIRLDRHVKSGRLRMFSARTITGSAETYLRRTKTIAMDHRARCLVIDPVSQWSKAENDQSARGVAERLIDWTKAEGITLVCTRLLDQTFDRTGGGSSLQISTIADTWIHLNYVVQSGERNRSLSIMKSRGTAHSNQVRELILSDEGVTLADIYVAGGETVMGTHRWEKERAARLSREAGQAAGTLKRLRLDAEQAELEARVKALQVELAAKQAEKALLVRSTQSREGELSRGRARLRELRGADAAKSARK